MCDTKVCSKCKQGLSINEFSKNKTNKDGLQNMCKRCAKEYRQSNKERLMKYHKKYEQANKERKKDYYKNNKHRRMLHDAKRRAKLKGLSFDITADDIVIPNVCSILEIKLKTDNNIFSNDSPTLDRITPETGYVKGNIQVISRLANTMKSNATIDQMIMLGEWAKKIKEKTLC